MAEWDQFPIADEEPKAAKAAPWEEFPSVGTGEAKQATSAVPSASVPAVDYSDFGPAVTDEQVEDTAQVKELANTMNALGRKITGQPDARPQVQPGFVSTQEGARPDLSGGEITAEGVKQAALYGLHKGQEPLNTLAKPVGLAADFVQKNLLRPFAVGMAKEFHKGLFPGLYMGDNDTPEHKAEVQKLLERGEGNAEFANRMKGTTWAQDVKPSKSVTPSAVESIGRALATSLTGEGGRLSKEQEASALPKAVSISFKLPFIEEHNIAEVLHGTADFVGELPFWAIGGAATERALGFGASASANVTAKVAEGEKAAALLGAKMSPQKVASLYAKGAAGAEAKSIALQSGVVASKNNEDVGSAMVGGYVTGAILGRLGTLLTGNSAGKKAAMSALSDKGLLLPPQTWKAFINEVAAQQAPRTAPSKVVRFAPEAKYKYNSQAPFTYKTVEMGEDGEVLDVRYMCNAKTGSTRVVHKAPLKNQSVDQYLATGRPEPTDRDAYGAFAEWYVDAQPNTKAVRRVMKAQDVGEDDAAEWLKNEYYANKGQDPITGDADTKVIRGKAGQPIIESTPQETATPPDNVINFNGKQKPAGLEDDYNKYAWGKKFTKAADDALNRSYDKWPDQPRLDRIRHFKQMEQTRGPANSNEEAIVLSSDSLGDVSVIKLVDRKPKQNVLSERAATPGDVVQLPHTEEPMLVVEERGDTVVLRDSRGNKVSVPKASVSLADEKLLPPVVKAKDKSELLQLGKLDIERVMKSMDIDNPVTAKSVLDSMVVERQIKPTMRPGEYEPVRLPKENTRKIPNDVIVYYDTSPSGTGKTGVIRGPDPRKPGNYLLEIQDSVIGPRTAIQTQTAAAHGLPAHEVAATTKTISVTGDQVRSFTPVLKGFANKSQLPQIIGITTPMPADVIVVSEASVKAVTDMSRRNGMLNKILSKPKVVADVLRRFWSHESFLVPLDVRDTAITLAAQPGIVKAESTHYTDTLSKQLGMLSSQDTKIAQIAKMNASKQGRGLSEREKELVKFFNANPQMAGEVEQTVRTSLSRLKANEQELAALGITNIAELEQFRAAGLEDEYITNVYLKYMMTRKNFAEFASKHLGEDWEKAIRLISQRNPGEYAWQIEARMLQVLGLDKQAMTAQLARSPTADVAKKLKERIAIADEINKVIGKLDSASVQIAHSLASTDSLLVRVKAWNKLKETPYWSPGPRADLGPEGGVEIPDLPIYGNARGGRIHESFRFLIEAKPAHIEARGILRSMSAMWKFNQVVGGGFGPWVNNWVRSYSGHMFSGGLQSVSDFGTFFDAAKIMSEYKDNPILNHSSLWKEAVDNGATGVGFAGSEINKNRNVRKILDAVIKQKGQSKDMWELASSLADSVKGGAQDVGEIYDAMDNLHKFTAYLNIRRRNLAKGMSLNDAAADATLKCRQSFAYYDTVAPTIEKMRQGSIAGIAPFLSSHAEDIRIRGTAMMRLTKEPDLVARMAVTGGVMTALAMLMREQRKANGVTDDMCRRALDANKLTSQAFRPGAFCWPELDKKGRIQIVDLTQWETMLILLQHHETDNLPASVIRNFANGYWGEDSLQGQVADLTGNALSGIVPLSGMQDPRYRPGENGIMNTISKFAQFGGVPQMPLKAWDNYQKTQPGPVSIKQSIEQEPWTNDQALTKFFGLPLAGPVGSRTIVGRARELQQNTREMQGQAIQSVMNKVPSERGALLNAKIQDLRRMIEEYNESKK